jgi:hypothetical protein
MDDELLAKIGELGPIIVFVYAVCRLLWIPDKLLTYYYTVGAAVNLAVNAVLKQIFRMARPSGGNANNHDTYGMPSYHTQAVSYTIAFLTYAGQTAGCSPLTLLGYATFLGITAWQRVARNHHTVSQVAVGILAGAVMGRIIYDIIQEG